MARVSAIIPAYNAEAFIREAVDSALGQTHADLEVIVVDDSSTDDTADVLRSYGDRIIVHRQPNAGVAAARNAGAQLASGAWVAFLDADDVWRPTKIAQQLALGGSPLSYTDRFNFGARGDLPEIQSDVTPLLEGDLFVPLLLHGNFITTSSVMIKRDLFLELGGFPRTPAVCEDWDLWLRAAEQHAFTVVPEPLVGYRFTSAGLSADYGSMSQARRTVVSRALARARGQKLSWHVRRKIWAETFRTNGWDAGRSGAGLDALKNYAKAAAAWPLELQTFKAAVKVCLDA